MQTFVILGLVILLSFTSISLYQSNINPLTPEQEVEAAIFRRRAEDFQEFKKVNHKGYQNNNEESYRLSIFVQNEEEIEKYNMSHKDVVLKVNEFTDLTQEEFTATHLGIQVDMEQVEDEFTHPILQQAHEEHMKSGKLMSSAGVNYKHLNNGIMRSQVCGDCWANAAASVTEMHFSTTKLSTQDLINCDTYANGCSGSSSIHNNLYHIITNGILPYNQQPYQGKELKCYESKDYKKKYPPTGTRIASFAQFYNPDCDKLKTLLKTFGPATVTLYAEQSVHWSNYYSGILSHEDDEDWILHEKGFYNINHAVVLIGYTEDYWIIQNSWGSQWGESGYAKLKMGNTFNICVNAAAYAHQTQSRTKVSDYQNSHFMEYR